MPMLMPLPLRMMVVVWRVAGREVTEEFQALLMPMPMPLRMMASVWRVVGREVREESQALLMPMPMPLPLRMMVVVWCVAERASNSRD